MMPKGRKVAFILVAFGDNCDNIPNSEMFEQIKIQAKNMYRDVRGDTASVRIARQVSAKEIRLYESVVDSNNQLKIIPCLQDGYIRRPDYLGTREVLELAKDALGLGGDPDELYIVCHKDHKPRVKALALNLGLLKINAIFHSVDSYDVTEPQLWCRYRPLFLLLEFVKILHHRLKGWM